VGAAEQRHTDENYMRMALSLAMRGTGTTSPNPRVGAVIVRDGRILGYGWHGCCGGPHAEVAAVKNAGCDISGATVYVTLEPCCHYGRTPPCAQMLVEHKVKRVVVGMTDPNPLVNCGGISLLADAGIDVSSGILEGECKWLNRGFIRRMTLGRPWVTVKTASSLDGDIAYMDRERQWITSADSREKVHMMRAENDALMTGVGTILADDPELTVREAPGRTPLKVVLDRNLRTPACAKVLDSGNVLFFADHKASSAKISLLQQKGACVELIAPKSDEQLGLILRKLCEKGVNYLMVEAGACLTSSFLASGLTDEVALFIAPKFMGSGLRYTDGLEIAQTALGIKKIEYSLCGRDLWIKGVLACSPDL